MLDPAIRAGLDGVGRRYGFNLTQDRFDVHVMEAFGGTKSARWTRDSLIAQVREGHLDHLLLRRLPGLEELPAAANEAAAINLIDYHFEPLVLQSMTSGQVENYFRGCQKTLHMRHMEPLSGEGPLWIDTVHHVCVFSVLYEFAMYLIHRGRYRKLVLLHQGQRPEPRLTLCAKLMRERHGVPWTYIRFADGWFSSLAKQAAPDTAIFYLVDMPQETSQRSAPRKRRPSLVQLEAQPSISIRVETVSGSQVFARRLGAVHLILDYPGKEDVQVRSSNQPNPHAHCPLEDWVFWPLLTIIEAPPS
jgi:hypothetical protein